MKTSWAGTGMLSSENHDFEFLETVKNIKSMCITPNLSVVDQKQNIKEATENTVFIQ